MMDSQYMVPDSKLQGGFKIKVILASYPLEVD